VLGGVDHRLPRRGHQRGQMRIHRHVADHHRSQGHRVGILHLAGRRGQDGREGCVGGRGRTTGCCVSGRAVQPGSEFPLLAARQPHHLAGIAGLALDEGERLQYGIVQMCRDLGAFPLPNAPLPLVAEIAHQPDPPRHGDDRDADQSQNDGDQGRPDGGEIQLPEGEN